IFLVAPVNPDSLRVGGTRTYTFALGRGLMRLGFIVTIVGTGPTVVDSEIDFVAVSEHSVKSNFEFHRCLARWSKHARFTDGDVINVQRPDFLRSFAKTSANLGLVSTLHGDPLTAIRQSHRLGSIFYGMAEEACLAASRKVICVSASALAEYVVRYPGLNKKATHIPNGVDLHMFTPMNRKKERDRLGIFDQPTLLYAGRLDPEK